MTTMNYPANYTVIAADEMVYLNGGTTIWESLYNNMNTALSWINLVRNPVYSLYYVGAAGKVVDGGVDSVSAVAKLIANVGYAIGYFGSSMSSWLALPELIG